MTEELNGKLRLTAMTLRGIGSYLHGARLDIRPLTVLCGKNGSGKSTWLQVLDMLRTWSFDDDFPFRDIWTSDRRPDTHDFTNAAVKDADCPLETIVSTQEDFDKYGPPGTIGVHFVVTESFALPPVISSGETGPDHDLTSAQSFLWRGRCEKGTRFSLRVALPTSRWDTSVWGQVIQLSLDDRHVIRFAMAPGPLSSAEYNFSCSAAFLPSQVQLQSELIPILLFRRSGRQVESAEEWAEKEMEQERPREDIGLSGPAANLAAYFEIDRDVKYENPWQDDSFLYCLGDTPKDPEHLMCRMRKDRVVSQEIDFAVFIRSVTRIRQLFRVLVSGYFHIGAIRQIRHEAAGPTQPANESCDPTERNLALSRLRHVGLDGESTLSVWRRFAYSQMRYVTPPLSGHLRQWFDSSQLDGRLRSIIVELLSSQSGGGRFANPNCSLEGDLDIEPEDRARAGRLLRLATSEDRDAVLDALQRMQPTEFFASESEGLTDLNQSIANLLNELLSRKDLYLPSDWPDPDQVKPTQLRRDFESHFGRYWELSDEQSGKLYDRLFRGDFQDFPDEDLTDDGRNNVLRLLWHLVDSPQGHVAPFYGNASGCLTLIGGFVEHPPPGEEANYLSRKLKAILRLVLDGVPPGREARFLIRQGLDNLCEQDRLRLNRLLIESVFGKEGANFGRVPPYVVDTQVSYWLKRLLDVGVIPFDLPWRPELRRSLGELWDGGASTPPMGILASVEPRIATYFNPLTSIEPYGTNPPVFFHVRSQDLFSHPCLGGEFMNPAFPQRLSAGFHQVAPIVVQSALVGRNEILAVENPEVHLHPSLQLDVTEFLLWHAKAGKIAFVETHSDLVVRRVLRAIVQEEISQGQVGLYFTDIEQSVGKYRHSRLSPLTVDEHGRIDNWPEGFMDDDVKESRRLLDAMYRMPEDSLSDDEEESE